jgi:transcriptional regulator with XRE-family HTH domain
MDTAAVGFGQYLKSQRERRGVVLGAIAASTKISGSLLADLERGDVSKWPRGIFRRAFVREYAANIGLAPESVVAEFVRLFPDEESGDSPAVETADLRLTFADGGRASFNSVAMQVATALIEMCAVMALARTVTWGTGFSFWMVCGVTSLAYYGLASAVCGRSLALRWLHGAAQRPSVDEEPERTNARDLLDLLLKQTQMSRPDGTMSSHAAAAESLHTASGVILPS